MAGTDGQASNHLIEELEADPFSFDFYRAVRLLESARRDLPRVGYSFALAQDALRFCQNPSLAFAPAVMTSQTPVRRGVREPARDLHLG